MANGFFGELINPQTQSPVPEAPAQTTAQPQVPPEQVAQNTQQWMGILNDPSVRAGLLQFGLNMMQPSWDSGAAPAFRAIGEGAEAAGRTSAAIQSQQDAQARQQEAAARTAIQQQELGLRERGQTLEYGLGQEKIRADQARLEREYQLKKELESMPPNLAELALKTWATIRANPPLNLRGPELEEWEGQQLEEAITAAKRAGSSLTPGAAAAPAPTSSGRIRLDSKGEVIEVPTQ